MLKTFLLAMGISLSGVAFSLDMPSIDLKSYSPKEMEGKFKCGYRTLQNIGDLPEDKAYETYAYYAKRASAWQINIPHRKNLYIAIYKKIHSELAANPEAKRLRRRGDIDVWDVPLELHEVLQHWSRSLTANKSEIEMDLCLFDWYGRQLKEYSSIPSEFVASYNSLYDSYIEVKNRCEKPDIQGWTQEQEAKDYVACMNGRRHEHNNLLRKLKSYQPLRRSYVPLLEELDIGHQLGPAL